MMQWRCANKPRKRRADRKFEAHLGDVIGEPLPPMRIPHRRRHAKVDWIKSVKHLAAAVAGVTFWTVLAIALLVSAFLAAKPALAGELIKPPRACVKFAALFGATLPGSFTRNEAESALAQIDIRMILVPEARRCRAAIILELKK